MKWQLVHKPCSLLSKLQLRFEPRFFLFVLKVEYVLNHHKGTLYVHEIVYKKFFNPIIGVVFLFDHMRCAMGQWNVLQQHYLSILSNIDYHLLNQYQHKVCKHACCNIIYFATNGAYAISKCFCCGCLQHIYNIIINMNQR